MLNRKTIILKDIIKIIKRIEEILQNMNFEKFKKSVNEKEAILYNLIILGEASKNLI